MRIFIKRFFLFSFIYLQNESNVDSENNKVGYFSLEYYQRYFDVNSDEVIILFMNYIFCLIIYINVIKF